MGFSLMSRIKDLITDEGAKAVLEKHVPGISKHPQLPMAYYMTLKEISYYPEARQAGLTKEKLAAIEEDLKVLEG
jgi:hypothetical protein